MTKCQTNNKTLHASNGIALRWAMTHFFSNVPVTWELACSILAVMNEACAVQALSQFFDQMQGELL